MAKIGDREVSTNEIGVLSAGVVLFIVSFFHWFGPRGCVSVLGHHSCGNFGSGLSAWHSGFFGWASVLLGLAAAGWVAFRRFAPRELPTLPVGENVVTFGLAALALVFALLKALVGYSKGSFGVSASLNRGIGLYLGILVLLVEAVFAYLIVAASGEKIPGLTRTATPPPS